MGIGISFTEDNSPLTSAYLESNHFNCNEIKKNYKDIPIVSEEGGENPDAVLSNYFWLVDPLDGTREFLSGSKEFTVNIALINDHLPIFGVIYAPALDLLFWGSELNGSYKKNNESTKKLEALKHSTNSPIKILASKSHMDKETQAFLDLHNPSELMKAGSSLKFCHLAEALADIYPRFGRTCGWDTAAGHAILKFAGGSVRDLNGHELSYGRGDKFNPPFIASR
jgi:3'(2'), 5'-bisphosphate nucleotidase